MTNNELIEKIMFKPCTYSGGGEEYLIMVFNVSDIKTLSKNYAGKVQEFNVYKANIVNITKTLEEKDVVIEDLIINDPVKAQELFVVEDAERWAEELDDIYCMLSDNILSAYEEMIQYQKCLNAVAYSGSSKIKFRDSDQDGKEHDLFDMNLTNIFEDNSLNQDEIANITPIFMKTLVAHKDIDVENEEELENLKKEIEWNLIQQLPNAYEVGDININTEKIKEILKQMKDEDNYE